MSAGALPNYPTLEDHANLLDPNGTTAKRVEILTETNEILQDQVWTEGNLPTGHETTYRAELPQVELVGYNEGVAASKSRYRKLRETCATAMSRMVIDMRLLELQSKQADYLAAEEKGHVQSMNNEYSRYLVSGNEADNAGKGIDGFLTRYSYLRSFGKADAWLKDMVFNQIIDAGGTGANCASLLLVGWGTDTVTGFFPQGSKAGFRKEEMGKVTVADSSNPSKGYPGIETFYYWDFGLLIRDPRYVVRLINIDMNALKADASTGAKLIDDMIRMEEKLNSLTGCRPAFYCSRKIREWLRLQILNKQNVNLTFDSVAGKQVLKFDGIPVRRVDAMDRPETAEVKP